jgi:predicted AlkP superfamily phosphohydrolase/phosphomutase/Tfp pilus assembly protein PilF
MTDRNAQTTSPARRPRHALFVVAGLLLALCVWAVAGLRSVPQGATGLLDSAVRGGRVLGPGTHWTLPGVESLEVLAPYRRTTGLTFTTPEGSRVELSFEVALRLDPAAARGLLAAGKGSTPRERLDGAVDGIAIEALRETAGDGPMPYGGEPAVAAATAALSAYGEVEGRLLLELEESPLQRALLEAEAEERIRGLARATGVPILIVGLDAADWQLADPLIERGLMPNLAALRERGAWGNIKALKPILSPLLWTSIATGVKPDRHGILDFLARDPATGEKVPTNSRFRKVRALWNQFTEAGRTSDVVAWWATWPAEPIDGHMISDRVSYSLFDFDLPSGGAGATWPLDYFAEIRPDLIGDEAISHEEVARFADITREEFQAARARIEVDRRAAYREPINHLTKILAATRNYHRIALDLIREEQADLTAVSYQGIDETCHRFMHYAPPRMEGVDPEDVRRYGSVIERFYAYQDRLLGELLQAVAEETVIIVVADHGFVNGPDRFAGETADIEGQPGRWHRPYGVLVLAGPPIAQGKLDTTSLLDISPTVLYLAGLPVPEDGDGRVLTEAIRPDFAERFPATSIATYETTPFRLDTLIDPAEMAAVDAEMLENLRALGYIGGGGTAGDPAADGGPPVAAPSGEQTADTATAHANLAGVLLAKGDLEGAEKEILAALERAPGFRTARHQLFDLRMRQGRHDEAIAIAERLMAGEEVGHVAFLSRVAKAYQAAGRAPEGIERFRQAVAAGRWQLGVPLSRLLLERGDRAGAERAARAVLEADPMNEAAMATLMTIARATGRTAELQPLLDSALEVNPRSVMHLNWLAIVFEARGDVPNAERLLRQALESDPDHGGSMANLGAFYARHGRAEEAIPLLDRALRIDPGNLEARVNLGTAFGSSGQLDRAIEQFERVVEGGHESTDVYNALARAYGEQGNLPVAADWLRRSLALNPGQPAIRQLLTRIEANL